ncbi:hypothetical protein [Novosphingobium guangzhouense]|uniref:Uncharacterized protein n=1 Tax=Novosphingobium guangzhouense TaxID=1850347 RepID=A0A2K2G3P7_9SPHN|nr:hypothetical protein [Novosphingobium guangzhouense]PNU05618.1 hypothetical protein A8V01_15815 [Novosphingobium guangzhouense]
MEANTLKRAGQAAMPRRAVLPVTSAALAPQAAEAAVVPLETDALSARLLRDAVREAGLFQRSVLGHLDHKEWRDRVFADGQRLIDLLATIGFRPSDQRR